MPESVRIGGKRLHQMSPVERGNWLRRIGARLDQLDRRGRTAEAAIVAAKSRIVVARAELEAAEAAYEDALQHRSGIDDDINAVRSSLQDFDVNELAAIGIVLPAFDTDR
ncbi:hypothetical protein NONI108955_21025 [Nocardia ninae]|uniref:Uncharacterized protein n=1 Tax=Nocardia ninae NBRC 108245 TaxID=1210091 RepID=A0A511MB78_9NOCA|nr:hypothetical protein [Nocardia ninae]GEM37437.1 hypothetical protein NN4_19560 [Nocardia ninae NBRC 108245]